VLRVLLERKLIRVLGRRELAGRPLIYATTKRFLEVFDLKDLKDLPTPKEIEEMGQALADRSGVVIEDDTADETRESQLELDFEESEIDEPTGLGDNTDNGAEPPESAEGVEPTDSEADSGYPRPS